MIVGMRKLTAAAALVLGVALTSGTAEAQVKPKYVEVCGPNGVTLQNIKTVRPASFTIDATGPGSTTGTFQYAVFESSAAVTCTTLFNSQGNYPPGVTMVALVAQKPVVK